MGNQGGHEEDNHKYEVTKTEEEWKNQLSQEQFHILRHKGTERAFTGKWWDNHNKGIYSCVGCSQKLFSSEHKFDSGTGWPSYFDAIDSNALFLRGDKSIPFMPRTEVVCSRCGGHLGHVFDDGPKPTGKRYCINGNVLDFKQE